jgi:hypothetical protein
MIMCIICKGENPISDKNPITDEHIIPEFIGGALTVSNVCKVCNSRMGDGFEGILANSLFYKLPRFIWGIEGKQKKLSFPFSGVYEDSDLGKFQVLTSGDLYLIPEIKLTKRENSVDVSMLIDTSELDKAEHHLKKKLSRYFKSEGKEINEPRVSKIVSELVENSEKKHVSKQGPQITSKFSLDLNSQVLLYIKIAYELAIYHFGNEYINDVVANKLRLSLKNLMPDNSIHGQFPADQPSYHKIFDDEHHWVLFLRNTCFVKIFGLAALIEFSEEEATFVDAEGVVYKFSYKDYSFSKLSLLDHIGLMRQPSQTGESLCKF